MAVFYGVGVGSGDPELMTLKSIRVINESDVIVVPSEDIDKSVAYNIVREVIPEIVKKEVIGIKMPMIKDKTSLENAHKVGADMIMAKLVIRDEMLHIIPSTYGVSDAMNLGGTKVFMKAGNQLKGIKEHLSGDDKKVYFIENCGMDNEKIIEGINNMPEQSGYYSMVIVSD